MCFNLNIMKKLARNTSGKVFLGVLSGMGDYLDTDPVLLRVIYILVTFITGIIPGMIAYLFAAVVMPVQK